MPKPRPIAILASDIHLSQKPPIARSVEPNWFDVMSRQFDELRMMQKKLDVPVIIAGDIFDRWNNPAELVNFAIDIMPEETYTIPGQHDLSYHNLSDIGKTSYWTLVKCGAIKSLQPSLLGTFKDVVNTIPLTSRLAVRGFPWGMIPDEQTAEDRLLYNEGRITLAVVHAYCWTGKLKYKDAPKSNGVKRHMRMLKHYDAAVFGDNHKGFKHIGADGRQALNCGTFFRRSIDERDYEPQVGILHDNGSIEIHKLDVSKDIFIDVDDALKLIEKGLGIVDFVSQLKDWRAEMFDFKHAVARYIESSNVSKGVARILREAMEG